MRSGRFFQIVGVTTALFLGGCTGEEFRPTQEPADPADAVQAEEPEVRVDEPPDASDVRVRADALVGRLVRALNDRKAETVAALSAIPPEIPDARFGAAAISDYSRFFGNQQIIRYERIGEEGNEPALGRDGTMVYDLVADNGLRKAVRVYYEARLDSMRVLDEFLRYSARVQSYAEEVIAALRAADAERLALLLSVDDIDYPVQLAVKAIANYEERFDLSSLQAVFVGLEPQTHLHQDRPFLYSVRGRSNGREIGHTIRIMIGDGLVGWSDSLIPTYYGV